MALAFLIGKFGLSLTAEEQAQLTTLLVTIATSAGGIAGLVMVVIGRKRTGDQIQTLKMKMVPAPKETIFGETFDKVMGTFMATKTPEGKILVGDCNQLILDIENFLKTPKGQEWIALFSEKPHS
jgi:hypothetical protein